jgi:ABC-type Fe3+/spermidine/putrescine transport system ATPase subunit
VDGARDQRDPAATGATTDRPQLTVRGLTKRFGDAFEVSDVDLSVGRDEIVALLGPSGCGKTTCLRCIAGVETPDAGTITIDGERVFGANTSKPPERRDAGMVYQDYAIWPHKTVYENVVFPLHHAGHDVPRDEYEARVESVLELMEIPELRDSPATELSGGEQQRTALARSLVHDPGLLLLDEPLSNLDRELRKHMRYELQRLQHELGVSVLYVTHDQEEAFYLADRVLVMNDGRVVERGTPRELYQRPSTPFTRRFIGVRNRFRGSVERVDGERLVRTNLVTFPLSNADRVADGDLDGDVVCFLRPDDVTIGQFAGKTDGRLELAGTVVAEGLLGDRYEVTVGFDGDETQLVVHTENYRDFDRGDEIRVQFQPKQLQVYAAENG